MSKFSRLANNFYKGIGSGIKHFRKYFGLKSHPGNRAYGEIGSERLPSKPKRSYANRFFGRVNRNNLPKYPLINVQQHPLIDRYRQHEILDNEAAHNLGNNLRFPNYDRANTALDKARRGYDVQGDNYFALRDAYQKGHLNPDVYNKLMDEYVLKHNNIEGLSAEDLQQPHSRPIKFFSGDYQQHEKMPADNLALWHRNQFGETELNQAGVKPGFGDNMRATAFGRNLKNNLGHPLQYSHPSAPEMIGPHSSYQHMSQDPKDFYPRMKQDFRESLNYHPGIRHLNSFQQQLMNYPQPNYNPFVNFENPAMLNNNFQSQAYNPNNPNEYFDIE